MSGSRTGVSQRRVDEVLEGYLVLNAQLTIVEGCAPGVDSQAENWARRHGAVERWGRRRGAAEVIDRLELEHWPAEWTKHIGCWCGPGKARCNYAGHRRNLEMRDSGSIEEVLCFHPDILNSRGTRNMARKAAEKGIPVRLIGSTMPL